MGNERQKSNPADTAKDAVLGYSVIILCTVCFVLSLAVVTAIVRIIIGAGAGA